MRKEVMKKAWEIFRKGFKKNFWRMFKSSLELNKKS